MRVCGLAIVSSLALSAAGCGQPEFAEATSSYALTCTAANGYPVNPFTGQVVCSFSNPIVFFAPHPDDETLGMGGPILAAKAAGRSVIIELMTRGDQSGGCGGGCAPPDATGCGNQRVAWFMEAARRMNVDGIYVNSDPSVPGSGPYVNTSVGGGFGDKQLLYSNGVPVNSGGGCAYPNMSPNPGVSARVNFWAAQGAALRGPSGTNELPHSCHPDHLAVNMAVQNAAASDKKYYMVYIHEDYSDYNASTNTHDAARVAGGSIAWESIHAFCGNGARADGCAPSTGSGTGLKWALGAYPWSFSTTGLFTGNYDDCTASTASAPAKAYFDPAPSQPSYALSVGRAGTGSGTVTSSPGGINCGPTCGASFAAGTVVNLAASPDPGSTFAGWSGACSSTGGCTVAMSSPQSVTATFNVDCVDQGCGCGQPAPDPHCGCTGQVDLGCGCGEPPPDHCGCGMHIDWGCGCGQPAPDPRCGCGLIDRGCGCGQLPPDPICGCGQFDFGCGCGQPGPDECGVCGGPGPGPCGCGQPGPDECGVCGGPGPGQCGCGQPGPDACGVCGGPGPGPCGCSSCCQPVDYCSSDDDCCGSYCCEGTCGPWAC